MIRNPFQESIQVIGEGYIGRHDTISYVMDILKHNGKDSGVVISGLTRMGKTSLVKKCFEDAKIAGYLTDNRIVCLTLVISEMRDFSMFLKSFADKLYDELEESNYIDEKLERFFGKMKDANSADIDRIYEQDRAITRIFKYLNKIKIKLVVLLDEFNDANRTFRYLNEELSTNFQRFRNYASEADYNITFLLTSRISISQVDESLPAGSNLRGVFNERVLVGFTDLERIEFFEKIKECGVELNASQKEQFIWYAGRSPFLFSKLACGILKASEKTPVVDTIVEQVFDSYKKDFNDYFDSLISFMQREEQYSKIIQLFFGPVYDLHEHDVERLMEYGYIYHNDDESFKDIKTGEIFTYQTLSEYFVEYLRRTITQDSALKIWSELIEAETILRGLIEKGLVEEFGEDTWSEGIKNLAQNGQDDSGNAVQLFNAKKVENFINSSKKNFGDNVDDNPLTVININELGNIIAYFWDKHYEKIFRPPYEGLQMLKDELEKLNRARNPLAHGTPQYLSSEDKKNVTACCKNIRLIKVN